MANTLTDLYADIYDAFDVVSRENTGFIPAITLNASAQQAALGTPIRTAVAPAAASENLTPAASAPTTGDQVIGNETVSITKSKSVTFNVTGEEEMQLATGIGYASIQSQQIAQAFRTLINEMEADIASTYYRASRAYGTAGTTPFGSANVLTDVAQVRKILDDNGAPQTELQLVVDSAAMANLRGVQSSLWKVNEAGTDEFLRQGFISQGLQGFALRNSGQVQLHANGTSNDAYLVNDAATTVGQTSFPIDTGTGTYTKGSVITFAGDTNKYVIGADAAGSPIVLNTGVLAAPADSAAITDIAGYTANLAFARSAVHLAVRTPSLPSGGDMADDVITVQDPFTGITFEFAVYRQFRKVHYHIAAAWGAACVKPEHTAILLG